MKNAARVTLNDVVLATVAGALVRFFEERGELPRKPLIASVPMAVATPGGEPREAGNRVTGMMTSLCTDIADPRERLQKIHEVSKQAKEVQRQLGEETALEWSEAAPAALYRWALGLYSQAGFSEYLPPPANVIVSNVRGPDNPLYVAGARLRNLYSVGPLVQGIGLNITGWSYGDRVYFVGLACPDQIADGQRVAIGVVIGVGVPAPVLPVEGGAQARVVVGPHAGEDVVVVGEVAGIERRGHLRQPAADPAGGEAEELADQELGQEGAEGPDEVAGRPLAPGLEERGGVPGAERGQGDEEHEGDGEREEPEQLRSAP